MPLAVAGFDWDAGNREKCRQHGVSLAEIEALFHAAPAVYPDPAHSKAETRYRAIGQVEGRFLFVASPAAKRRRYAHSPDQRAVYAREGGPAL